MYISNQKDVYSATYNISYNYQIKIMTLIKLNSEKFKSNFLN